ncbi:MAG: hypothetical protein A2061_09900 [Gallionellales bacterium GWA2_59_43]|nr:MAG: hypothetical protein A2061_09900 [Gallionellales bacterium GWA2_59_43]
MRATTNTEQNQAAGIIPWRVLKVNALPVFQLSVQFIDGTEGIVDMAAFLRRDCGIFESLRDAGMFSTAHIENGAVTWENGLDLAPDRMYDELQNAEVYVVR